MALAMIAGIQCSSSSSSDDDSDAATGGVTAVSGTGGGGAAQHSAGSDGSPSGGSTSASGGSSTALGGGSHAGSGDASSAGGSAGAGGMAQPSGGSGGALSPQTGGAGPSGGTTGVAGSLPTGGTGGLVGTGGDTGGTQIFVATDGDDTNPGTQDKPYETIAAAQGAVRASSDRGKVPITVNVLPGTYYVGKTIVFTSADSGTEAAPVTYRGGGGTATLSGGARLELRWSAYKDGIMQASVPKDVSDPLSFDVLFLNGERQVMARYPNYDANKTPFGGTANDYTRAGSWSHSPVGGFVHCMHTSDWGSQHYVIKGVNGSNLSLSDPLCNARASGLNGSGVVENIFDELDAPGEWYFDKEAGILYFYPPQGTDLGAALIEVAGLERIVEFQGTSSAPVKWINLDGFRYSHTSRTFTQCDETILRSDWNIYRGGSVFVSGAEDSVITNSFFDNVGGNALFVSGYNRRIRIASNKFIGSGASAIMLMGLSSAVRNPVFGYYGGTVSVSSLDKTPGPKTDDYPAQCTVTDNLIHDIGYPQKQVAGVGIDMAQDITVSHNSIYNMPRAGINIGDGCWGGHIVEYNDVFDTVLETGDHGAFNSWGRDRFWDADIGTIESRVASSPGLELLDVVKPITLRNNRWRCDRGWDVDLDDGSTNYVITNNIFLAGGLKWREGYQRTAENNMFNEKARMSVHVWPKDNRDVFTHNIFNHYDVVNPNGWGEMVDYNLFTDAAALNTAHGYGIDAHSASGSPGYLDAANGNYQLNPTSPALALGIQSIPADSYGVTSLGLRAQARTPFFGAPVDPQNPDPNRDPTSMDWRGAQVKNLIGLDERSATGMGDDIGVLVISVPDGSPAAKDGFKVLDVILELGGAAVGSLDDLNRLYAATTAGQEITLGVHRQQQDVEVIITR
jgi:hypothetical protein